MIKCVLSGVMLLTGLGIAYAQDGPSTGASQQEKIERLEAELEAIKALILENADENARLRQVTDELRQENRELRNLIEQNARIGARQQEETKSLQEESAALQKSVEQTSQQSEQAHEALKQENEELQKQMLQLAEEIEESPFDLKFYGTIKLDMSYDSARTSTGNFARWVESEAFIEEDDDQFNITARQTKLGIDILAPEVEGWKISAKVEIDFYRGDEEDSNVVRMRHAYLLLQWQELDLGIIAGQTNDVIGPLSPPTVNFSPLWWAGNPGYRRPQLRVTKNFTLAESGKLGLEVAAVRTIGDLRTWTGIENVDTGEDSGFPTVQGRVSLGFPLGSEKPVVIGFSGHWGKEEYDLQAGDDKKFTTWSMFIDLTIPLGEKFVIQGEVWAGENLDTYYAGIGQGINTTSMDEITAMGGWVAFSIGPFEGWKFNLGAAIDDPKDSDLNGGGRERNQVLFVNIFYDVPLLKGFQVAAEVSYWNTQYRRQEDGDNWRTQCAFLFSF